MQKVKMLGQVFTTSHGVLKTGDILTCDDAFARHLVVDCKAAEYLTPVEPVVAVESAEDAPKRRGRPAK